MIPIVSLEPRETALIVIDAQNAFCHPDGTLGQSGVDVTPLLEVVPAIERLVERCRTAGIQDIWTRQIHFADDRTRDAHRITPHTLKRKRVACQPGSWDAEIVDELKPLLPGPEYVIDKHKWGIFYGTRLDPLLRILGTKLLVVCGTTTNACLDTSVREAYMRDYDVVVVRECVAGVKQEWHEMALEVWSQYIGEVVGLDELEAALPERSAAA